MDDIDRLLGVDRPGLEEALARALLEKEDLTVRLTRVEDAIARANAALGRGDTSAVPPNRARAVTDAPPSSNGIARGDRRGASVHW